MPRSDARSSIVANQMACRDDLLDAVQGGMLAGPYRFTLLVPATRRTSTRRGRRERPTPSPGGGWINRLQPPLSELKVRLAIKHAIDATTDKMKAISTALSREPEFTGVVRNG